jgi:tripartite ATP-independent transporter DctP family solute receptor
MRRAILVVLAGMFLFAVATERAATAAPKWRVKLGHDHKEDSPHHQAALLFKKKIEEATKGDIEITIYPTGLLGTGIQMVEMVQAGALEFLAVPTSNVQVIHPSLQIIELPFLFPKREEMNKALDGDFGKALVKPLLQKGITGLSFWESGFKQLTCNYPIRRLEDMKGKKFRIMPSPVIREQFKAWGASPVPIDFQELYNALQQGVVDGEENPLMTIVTRKFYEVQKYVTLSSHAWLGYLFMVNKKFLESLPADYQKLIRQTAMEAAVFERGLIVKQNEDYLNTIKASGKTEVIELTPDAVTEFQKASAPVYEWFRQNIKGGEEYLDMLKK